MGDINSHKLMGVNLPLALMGNEFAVEKPALISH